MQVAPCLHRLPLAVRCLCDYNGVMEAHSATPARVLRAQQALLGRLQEGSQILTPTK